MVVVWLFLRHWHAPSSRPWPCRCWWYPAFIGMHLLGFSINVITLLALSLVVGILVDDAIVEVENIVRHLRMGKTPYQAAMEAADEIGLAVVAAAFTLIAVYLPTAFISGIAGRFFKQFGWTAALAVFASLVVARLLTPMMSAYLLKPLVASEHEPRWLAAYMRAGPLVPAPSLADPDRRSPVLRRLAGTDPAAPSACIPADDNAQTQVMLELPPGAKLQETQALALRAGALAMGVGDVRSIYTTVSGGSAGTDPILPAPARATRARPHSPCNWHHVRSTRANRSSATPAPGHGEARRARQGGPRQLRRRIHPGPGQRKTRRPWPRRRAPWSVTSAPSAASAESAARQAWCGPRSRCGPTCPRRRPGRDLASHRRDPARGHRGRLRAVSAQAESGAARVPIVVRLDDAARQDLSVLERLAVPGNHGPVRLGEVASLTLAGGPR